MFDLDVRIVKFVFGAVILNGVVKCERMNIYGGATGMPFLRRCVNATPMSDGRVILANKFTGPHPPRVGPSTTQPRPHHRTAVKDLLSVFLLANAVDFFSVIQNSSRTT